MDEDEDLKQRLRAIEARYAGAFTRRKDETVEEARLRIGAQLAQCEAEGVVEWQFTVTPWSRKVLMALARRYGLRPYRYRRQRQSTIVVVAPERFLRESFLPQFDGLCDALYEHFTKVTEKAIAEAFGAELSEEHAVENGPVQLDAFAPKPPETKR
jgi:hypothetical protein